MHNDSNKPDNSTFPLAKRKLNRRKGRKGTKIVKIKAKLTQIQITKNSNILTGYCFRLRQVFGTNMSKR